MAYTSMQRLFIGQVLLAIARYMLLRFMCVIDIGFEEAENGALPFPVIGKN